MEKRKLRIGFTIGDINGIGIELFLRIFNDKRLYNICTPILYANSNICAYYKKALKLDKVNYSVISDHNQVKEKQINIYKTWDESIKITMGVANTEVDNLVIRSIEQAIIDYKDDNIEAIVTLPVNKRSFQATEEKFPGHTEMFAKRFEEEDYLMMMVHDKLHLALATIHIPIKYVSGAIKEELILNKLTVLNNSLKKDFGISKPKIAVLGLNPHAGDNGLIGKEEQEIIIPAIEKASNQGILAFGPFPADGLFGGGGYNNFDGILAMYHDQGLAPFKLISGTNGGVNYTAGMNYVRTSPDHGTAYDLVGKKTADTKSLLQAIYLAYDIVISRLDYSDLFSDSSLKMEVE